MEGSRLPRRLVVLSVISRRDFDDSPCVLALSACNTTYLEERTDQPQNAADVVRAADLRPREPQPTGGTVSTGASSAEAVLVLRLLDASSSPNPPAPQVRQSLYSPGAEPAEGGYTLNFDNAPISQVAKSVLGDILGVGYVIDPRAQGTITLSSGRPIDKRDMLFVLENALARQ